MSEFLYFSYGSNILSERLRSRCKTAEVIGLAVARDRTVEFSKSSKDGSGKASLVEREGASWTGRLFRISKSEQETLDKEEGAPVGYRRVEDFTVYSLEDGSPMTVTTYLANKPPSELLPYDWYLALVIAGHIEARLPQEQIKWLSEHLFHAEPVRGEPCLSEEYNRRHADGLKKARVALSSSGFTNIEDVFLRGRASAR